jgi:hypothetical protein
MEPRSADAVFLSAVLYAAVAVLYAQVLQVQRSSLLSVALTPQAPSRSACLPRSRCSPTLRSSCSSHRNTYTVLTLIMLLCIQIRANCPSEPPKTQPRPTYAGAAEQTTARASTEAEAAGGAKRLKSSGSTFTFWGRCAAGLPRASSGPSNRKVRPPHMANPSSSSD